MIHLDLFSGIGGFAYAADSVWGGANVEHIFCDFDPFCRQVLAKHWPESEIIHDIRSITADTDFVRHLHGQPEVQSAERRQQAQREPEYCAESSVLQQGTSDANRTRPQREDQSETPYSKPTRRIDILTGGFPCQPFSATGLRRGTADERHLWPEMLRVIRLTQPEWVIAENVRGILTWNDGMVFEQVCLDLEAAGYEVQPFVIPAVAVNAPHRRDRVWFVAHAGQSGAGRLSGEARDGGRGTGQDRPAGIRQHERSSSAGRSDSADQYVADPASKQKRLSRQSRQDSIDPAKDTGSQRSRGRRDGDSARDGRQDQDAGSGDGRIGWDRDWATLAAELCSVDDGLPVRLGEPIHDDEEGEIYRLTKAKHRAEQLKAYGNAIVPEVVMEIMRGMVV